MAEVEDEDIDIIAPPHFKRTYDPVREEDKPKLAGPVMMWADVRLLHQFEGVCHRCGWTVSEALMWTRFYVDERWIRAYIMWHTGLPHENGLPMYIVSQRAAGGRR